MDDKDWTRGLQLVRILKGNAVNTAALLLIGGGVSTLSGWVDKAFQAIFNLSWGDTPAHVGWILTALGIALLLLNLYLNGWKIRPSNAKDMALIQELRESFTAGQLDFLKTESFYNRWHRSHIDPINNVADNWNNAHKEFVDRKLNKQLEKVKRLCEEFSRQEDMGFSEGRSMDLRTLRTIPDQQGLSQETRRKIEKLRATSQALAKAYEELERTARQRLPDA